MPPMFQEFPNSPDCFARIVKIAKRIIKILSYNLTNNTKRERFDPASVQELFFTKVSTFKNQNFFLRFD